MLENLRYRLLGRQKPGIIFVHVPKTGGSSISSALRKHYRLSKFNIKIGSHFPGGAKKVRYNEDGSGL